LVFDFNNKNNSPLLAGAAEEYYDRLIANAGENALFYQERKEDLQNFIKALRTINKEMPWYWQSLTGVERLLKFDPNNPYFGGDEATLTITTLESINLAITGLMHLYRKAAFDEHRWSWILPKNLRDFGLLIYATEIRAIKNFDEAGINPFKKKVEPLTGTQYRPYFMFSLGFCQFDITSGTTAFSELSKNPEEPESSEIVIKYKRLNHIESRVLNGIVKSTYNTDKLSPAPDFEERNGSITGRIRAELESLGNQAVDDLERLSRDKKLELEQFIRNRTTNQFQNPGNLFKNFVRRIDEASDINQQTRNLGAAIQDNVYGVTDGDTIGDALNIAATRSLGNVYG
jgi:hypothetical protein